MRFKSLTYFLLGAVLVHLASCASRSGADAGSDAFVCELMAKMTLEEKLDQQNLYLSDYILALHVNGCNCLRADESRNVKFEMIPDLLKFYNCGLACVCKTSDFLAMVGPDNERLSVLPFILR